MAATGDGRDRRSADKTARVARAAVSGAPFVEVNADAGVAIAAHTAVRRLPLNVEALPVAVLLPAIARERTPLGESAIRCKAATVEDRMQRDRKWRRRRTGEDGNTSG